MATTVHVDVVSADQLLYSGEAEFVVAPGESGELGIYPRHTPLLTRLKPGSVRIQHDGEEELILQAFVALKMPRALLILTPRHPQRFDLVAAMLIAHKLSYVRRTALDLDHETDTLSEDTQVLLGDSMGEMYMYYAACDVAFVGGSLVALGGHNLIEACAMGKPVLTGPHTFNFSEITDQAIAADAAIRVADAQDVMKKAQALLDDTQTRIQMGENAYAFFLQHQGATDRTLQVLRQYL